MATLLANSLGLEQWSDCYRQETFFSVSMLHGDILQLKTEKKAGVGEMRILLNEFELAELKDYLDKFERKQKLHALAQARKTARESSPQERANGEADQSSQGDQ